MIQYFDTTKFYFDTNVPSNGNNYFRWEFQEDYKWHTPFYKSEIDNSLKNCYPRNNSNNVFVLDASQKFDNKITHLEASFVSEYEIKLNYEYLLSISLYTVNFNNYQFWNTIKQTNSGNDGLYGVIPTTIQENIYTCDPYSHVIGSFKTSVLSKKIKSSLEIILNWNLKIFMLYVRKIHTRMETSYPNTSIYHVIFYYVDSNTIVFVVRPNLCYDYNVKYFPNNPSFCP